MSDSKKFYTADTHFGHANAIKYCNRPFTSAEEMDEVLIENWNSVVRPGDIVYHLGDFAFYKEEKDIRRILKRLNGQKWLIWGNHDKIIRHNITIQKMFVKCGPYHEVVDGEDHVILSHYKFSTWNKSHHGSIHLFGHSHGTLEGDNQCQDVGTDCWNYFPITIEQIKSQLKKNPIRKLEFPSPTLLRNCG